MYWDPCIQALKSYSLFLENLSSLQKTYPDPQSNSKQAVQPELGHKYHGQSGEHPRHTVFSPIHP